MTISSRRTNPWLVVGRGSRLAVRLWDGDIDLHVVKTPTGHRFRLLNLPYFLVHQLDVSRLGGTARYRGAVDAAASDDAQSGARRRRSALPMTDSELSVMAALAQMGLISRPATGYSTPAATGTPMVL